MMKRHVVDVGCLEGQKKQNAIDVGCLEGQKKKICSVWGVMSFSVFLNMNA